MNKVSKFILFFLVATIVAVPAGGAHALFDDPGEEPPEPITTPGDIEEFLEGVMNWLYLIIGIIVVIMLILAGWNFITASGDQDKVNKGKDMVKYALIGVAVMVVAGGVFTLIEAFFGE